MNKINKKVRSTSSNVNVKRNLYINSKEIFLKIIKVSKERESENFKRSSKR